MTTMLYQSPGHKTRPDGTYGWKIFDDGDVEAALAAGWHKTARDAIAAASKPVEEKPKRGRKRARTDVGQFQADDPATPDVNEAWEE
jgi:hypothetical protein